MSLVKPKLPKSLRPITKEAIDPMNQSKLQAYIVANGKSGKTSAGATISFGFTSDWTTKWRKFWKSIA